MKKRITFFVLFQAAVILQAGAAINVPVGGVFSVVPDARTTAMGKAFCSVADDSNALFYNPAGLAQVNNYEWNYSANYFADDTTHRYIGFAYNLRDMQTSNVESMGTIALGYEPISVIAVDGRDLAAAAGNAQGRVLALGYGKTVFQKSEKFIVMAGMTAKLYDEMNIDPSAAGHATDAGLLFKCINCLNVGFSALNIAGQVDYNGVSYSVPVTYKYSLSGHSFNGKFSAGIDYSATSGNTSYNAGIEYRLLDPVTLRVGYDSQAGSDNKIIPGFGINLRDMDIFFFYAREINFNYAYASSDSQGKTHILSFLFKLGAD